MRIRDSFGRWTLVAVLAVCCCVPGRLAAQDSFAGKKAGQDRSDNELKLKLCWCPPGKFKMGGPEHVVVAVTLSRGFWIGKCEVTQAQYMSVTGKNPSRFQGEALPVEYVRWTAATEFCQKLTKMEREAGRLPKGWEYRLPTEAQWEYACRAGTTTVFSFGDDAKQLGDYAWYLDNSDEKTHPAGQKKPNAWGLCDIHGNVDEWCRDEYEEYRPGGTDPEVKASLPFGQEVGISDGWVIRGGSWGDAAKSCRSAYRYGDWGFPRYRDKRLGFRVAAVPTSQQAKNE